MAKKTFTANSKEEAEQKATTWLASHKNVRVLSKKTCQLATTPRKQFEPKRQEWETLVEYE